MAAEPSDAVMAVTYEELANIEDEFDEVDVEIMRQQYTLSTPLYIKRASAISSIPSFWALVLEQAPPEIDQFIQPSDSQIFAESLLSLSVSRPELDAGTPHGTPKTLKIRFEFKPNDFFSNTVLEKDFFYRRAKDGWSGLVSEPVKIDWKKGKDLSEGLTDGAYDLFAARQKSEGEEKMTKTDLPEYTSLKKKVEHLNGAGTSFFTWFGWVSGRRYVSAEESAAATAEKRSKHEARKAGTATKPAVPDEAPEDEEETPEDDDQDVEVHEMGEDLAVAFAEDLWPNAIKYFLEAQEADALSEADFEDDDEEDEEMDDDDEAEEVDLRALINGKGKTRTSDIAPPAKKRKA